MVCLCGVIFLNGYGFSKYSLFWSWQTGISTVVFVVKARRGVYEDTVTTKCMPAFSSHLCVLMIETKSADLLVGKNCSCLSIFWLKMGNWKSFDFSRVVAFLRIASNIAMARSRCAVNKRVEAIICGSLSFWALMQCRILLDGLFKPSVSF